MYHIAILKKQFLDKILHGEKTIESRWSKYKIIPHKRVNKGDIIYLKESGKEVKAKAVVEKTLYFEQLDKEKIMHILDNYGEAIGTTNSWSDYYNQKNYCTLIFLKDIESIEPFKIHKKNRAPWLILNNEIKLNELKC